MPLAIARKHPPGERVRLDPWTYVPTELLTNNEGSKDWQALPKSVKSAPLRSMVLDVLVKQNGRREFPRGGPYVMRRDSLGRNS